MAAASTRPPEDPVKERKKLLALADRLVLQARGLTSSNTQADIEMAEEYLPLAGYVIDSLKEKP